MDEEECGSVEERGDGARIGRVSHWIVGGIRRVLRGLCEDPNRYSNLPSSLIVLP